MKYDEILEQFINHDVYIYWEDIAGYSDSWMDRKEIMDMRPHSCVSIGRVLEMTEEYLTIVATWDDAKTIVSDVNCIPLGCITKIAFVDPLMNVS
jgi:uncharacterized protein YdbL (DUF1318 family)